MIKQQARSEGELRKLKNDLDQMKKTRVKLMTDMRENEKRNKNKDSQKQREINALKKDQRKRDVCLF